MRKGATLFLALALLMVLAAGSADAWVRARMYDGGTPMGPQWAHLEKPSWEVETKEAYEEIRSGELNGPALDQRFSWRVLCTEQQSDNKVKVRIDDIDNTKDTSILWSGCVATPPVVINPMCDNSPQVYIRIAAGSVMFGYNNDTTGGALRGWYCERGTRLTGGVLLFGTTYGMPVAHDVWHRIQVTAYTNGTWEMWVNDGDTLGVPDMTGTLDAGNAGNYVQWGHISSNQQPAKFYTEYCNWGQEDEIVIPEAIGGVSSSVVGNAATIAWNTTNTVLTNNKVYYGTTYHQTPLSADGVWVTDHWEAALTGLDYNQVYTFYCEQRDDGTGWEADTRAYSLRTDTQAQTDVLNPGFESGVDIYPWVDVYAPLPGDDDTQRWGRVYRDIDFQHTGGAVMPLTPEAFSGFKTGQTAFRKNSVSRQKITVTPGTWYQASTMFCGWGNLPYGEGDMVGYVGLDPNGHDAPGTRLLDGSFTSDPDVSWGQAGAGVHGTWRQAVTYSKAIGALMSLFLRADYNLANTGVRIAFDDVTFGVMDPPPPTTCAGAKTAPTVPYPVDLQDVVVTLAQFDALGNAFGYVEDAGRTAGIRIYEPASSFLWDIFTLGVDTKVNAAGILEINSDQELQVRLASISAAGGTQVINPFGTTNKSVGGGTLGLQVAVENGVGTNNIGLLIRTWGKVTAVEPAGVMTGDEFSVFIDDGSALVGGVTGEVTTHPGIEVVVPLGLSIDPDELTTGNKYLLATGAASMKSWDPGTGAVLKPLILIRDENDIQYSDF